MKLQVYFLSKTWELCMRYAMKYGGLIWYFTELWENGRKNRLNAVYMIIPPLCTTIWCKWASFLGFSTKIYVKEESRMTRCTFENRNIVPRKRALSLFYLIICPCWSEFCHFKHNFSEYYILLYDRTVSSGKSKKATPNLLSIVYCCWKDYPSRWVL